MTTVLDAMTVPAVWMIVRISLLLAGVGLAHVLLVRRTSAAVRHLLLTLAIAGLLTLPALSAVIPGWEAVRLPAPAQRVAPPVTTVERVDTTTNGAPISVIDRASTNVAASPRTPSAPRIQWSAVLLVAYGIGIVFLTLRLAAERWTMRTLARRATELSDPEWTRLQIEC